MSDKTKSPSQNETMINPSLLDILVCPLTHQPLKYDKKKNELVSEKAKLAFPVRDGIPILLADEARAL
ncbi:MAG: Trm112 family protein [Parvibaculales bacterium]